jgi:hypothetical protein
MAGQITVSDWVSLAVAGASLAVAGATYYLARKTKKMAEETAEVAQATKTEADAVVKQAAATEEQAEISASALRAAIRQWLTRSDSGREVQAAADNAQMLNVNVWVQNVGPAIALIPPDGCTITGGGIPPNPSVVRKGYAGKPVLPPGAETVILFRVVGDDINAQNFWNREDANGDFLVSIEYTDGNGGQEIRADFHIVSPDRTSDYWVFDQVDYIGLAETGEELDLATVKFLTNP